MGQKYEVVRPIGQGYFALVQQVRDTSSGRILARKSLLRRHSGVEEYRHRFQREIRMMNELKGHPNIVPILDFDDDELWYTMPLAHKNLEEYVSVNNTTLGIDERLDLFSQILAGMSYAHSKSISHRDLAPWNILMIDGAARVSDFGLGKDWKSLSMLTTPSVNGYGPGVYAAPEQLAALDHASPKSDIYSLGLILYFVLTGRTPNRKLTATQFSILIEHATQDDPDERYQNISDFTGEYERIRGWVLNPPTASGAISLVEQLAKRQSWTTDDLSQLHAFLTEGQYNSHIWDDYVRPVIRHLDGQLLHAYTLHVGSLVTDFVITFTERLHDMCLTVGWPFKELDSISSFLLLVTTATSHGEAQLRCLQEVLDIGYNQDQWSAQRQVIPFLRPGAVSNDVHIGLASHIVSSQLSGIGTFVDRTNGKVIAPVIKDAIERAFHRASANGN